MDIDFTKVFNKQFGKLPLKKQQQAKNSVSLFMNDMLNPKLRNHGLRGEWQGYHSISAGGDLRLHFKIVSDNKVLFVAVGSHSKLYK